MRAQGKPGGVEACVIRFREHSPCQVATWAKAALSFSPVCADVSINVNSYIAPPPTSLVGVYGQISYLEISTCVAKVGIGT